MNIEKLPLTWSWLGGFFQAEGSILDSDIRLSQTYGNGLQLVRDFLLQEFGDSCHVGLSDSLPLKYVRKGGECASYSCISIARGRELVLNRLLPYLRYDKLLSAVEKTCVCCNTLPFDDDWIIGFWEGDGSIQLNKLSFMQKDVRVLYDIQQYLVIPSKVRQHGTVHRLDVNITLGSTKRVGELLTRVRTSNRQEQLARL